MKKLNEKKGFTLAELLVVVAIIAVLVAVSIPIFTSQLEKARESTDLANLRAAKAAATTAILSGDGDDYKMLTDAATKDKVYYDAQNGKLTSTKPTKGYGKGTAAGAYGDVVNTDAKGVIKVTYTAKVGTTPEKLTVTFDGDDSTAGENQSLYSSVIGG